MKKKKVFFILPSLKAGGAERVLSFLHKSIDPKKYHSTLVVIGHKKDAVYEFDTESTIFLEKTKVSNAVGDIIKVLRREKPDIVMSSIIHINMIMGVISPFFPKIKFIGRLASVASQMSRFSGRESSSIFKWLSKYSHRKLDMIVCQSKDMMVDFHTNYGISEEKMIVINNPITSMPNTIKEKTNTNNVVNFITIGRLSKEKGHTRLLEALAKIKNYNFKYTIVGNGPMHAEIVNTAHSLNLSEKINHIPFTDKVNEILVQHDVFLQGSYVEGFPNATLESCSVGVPVLAFECPGGTKEIIHEKENGFLAKSQTEYEEYLQQIELVLNLDSSQISKKTIERFSSERIVKQYESVFELVLC